MTVVLDLGCHTHPRYPEDESTAKLIARFAPELYLGFDPHPETEDVDYGTPFGVARIRREAAWTFYGRIAYDPRPDRPLAAAVGAGLLTVSTFDLAEQVALLARTEPGPLIVKMDVEGAEYPLVSHLIARGVDHHVELLLVEWHSPPIGPSYWETERDRLLAGLSPGTTVETW